MTIKMNFEKRQRRSLQRKKNELVYAKNNDPVAFRNIQNFGSRYNWVCL